MVSKTNDDYEPYGNGTWYIKKSIGKYILDGTQNWTYQSTHPRFVMTLSPKPLNDSMCYSTIYVRGQTSSSGSNNTMSVASGTGYNQLLVHDERFTTKEDFNTWLSSNNVPIYYILQTPTYTQITGTLETQLENVYQKLLSYSGTTNINQVNNDLPFVMNVSAIEK